MKRVVYGRLAIFSRGGVIINRNCLALPRWVRGVPLLIFISEQIIYKFLKILKMKCPACLFFYRIHSLNMTGNDQESVSILQWCLKRTSQFQVQTFIFCSPVYVSSKTNTLALFNTVRNGHKLKDWVFIIPAHIQSVGRY